MIASKTSWAGRAISGIAVLFLIFDASLKLLRLPVVLEASAQLGFSPEGIVPTGVLLIACTTVYVIPRSAALGAVLLTGYLGGAVTAHVRIGNPLFETFFPIIVGTLIWSGLILRDDRLGAGAGVQDVVRRS